MAGRAGGKLLLYLVVFVAAWTGYVLLVYRHVRSLGEGTFAYAAANVSVRLAVWVIPVFLYLRCVDRVNPWHDLKLADGWKRGVLIGLGGSALLLATSSIRFGRPEPSWGHVTWNSVLSTSIGIGFFEEIPFRGFILQKLSGRVNSWLANVLTSLLFVGMHLPGWFLLGLFSAPLAVNVFVSSLVLGVIFRYARSLWACIILHSANDFISDVLFHGRS